MLLVQRADLPAAAVVPLGVLPLLVVGTLGCVAVIARPNARATGAFWLLPLLSAAGCGCLAADRVSTPVRCCCAAVDGVALLGLPLEYLVAYLGVLVFSLSGAALLGVDLGLALGLAVACCCCSLGKLLLAEVGLNAGRCCHLVRVVSFESIKACQAVCSVLTTTAAASIKSSMPSRVPHVASQESNKHVENTDIVGLLVAVLVASAVFSNACLVITLSPSPVSACTAP